MDAREKLRTDIVTQRVSQISVGDKGEEYAKELDKFMKHTMDKYGMSRERAVNLVIHYMFNYTE